MKTSKSLKRFTTLANIRHSLTELNIFNESKSFSKDDSMTERKQPQQESKQQPQSPHQYKNKVFKVLSQQDGSQRTITSPKKFEPNIKIQRKRDNPQSNDIQKQYIETLTKSNIVDESLKPKRVQDNAEQKTKYKPKQKILNFGQMAFGGKQSNSKKLAKQKIDLQKKKKAKAEKKNEQTQKLKQNSWIHLSEKGTNQYMPTVLPFFNNFDAQRQSKLEIKKMKEQGKNQRQIEQYLIKTQSQDKTREKTIRQILVDNIDPDESQLLHFQMPRTLPLKTELKRCPAGQKLGKLRIMKSGKVKMVLQNGLQFDVNRGIQAVFYQQGIHLIGNDKKCEKLGQISNKCIVSPNLQNLFS